ncbi:hypothetical protein HYH02_005539 [Chlamydomonas schloesseri]|uniref:ERD4-related membrane protein n=1 Tax=Chlamydomonas schloesseri TaxID=2026947 RepID=A0A835WLE2_9CHLO|nr:hypothetical protein HYH02_005539 [Chlamydomonas schloesseri]|eukprot:KAG2449389.1 hypothetical protein HYH02_005539 [Chlamydomonas schloesseri]
MPEPSPPPPSPVALVNKHYYVNDIQVVDSLFINLLWGAICLILFVAFRGWLKGPGGVFQRRHELQDLFMRPPRMLLHTVRQTWNWIMPMLAISDADMIRSNGFDALIMTRVLLIGLQMMSLMTLLGVGVLIPIYYTRGDNVGGSSGVLALMSISNLERKSKIGLVPFFFTYAFCVCCCFVLWINSKCYVQLRSAYFLCLDALPQEEALAAAAAAEEEAATAAAAAGAAVKPHSPHTSGAGPVAESREPQSGAPAKAGAGAGVGSKATAAGGAGAGGAGGAAAPLRTEQLLAQAEVAGGCAGGPPAYTGVDVYLKAAVVEQEMEAGGRGPSEVVPWAATREGVLAPEMPLGSTWLNMGNFVNPTLRMLLDHLDWMSPLQRAAAHYGIRNLRWPYPWSDEPPPYAWQYDPKRQPLLELDDDMEVRLNALRRRRGRQLQQQVQQGNGVGAGGGKKGTGAAAAAAGGGGGGDVDDGEIVMPAVLPYWRPSKLWRRLMAFGGVTDAAVSGNNSNSSNSLCVVGIAGSSGAVAAGHSPRGDSAPLLPPSQQLASSASSPSCPVTWAEGASNALPLPPPLPPPLPANPALTAAPASSGAVGRAGSGHAYLRRRVTALQAEAAALASAAAAADARGSAGAGGGDAAAVFAAAGGDAYVRHGNAIAQAVVTTLAGSTVAPPQNDTSAAAAAAKGAGGAGASSSGAAAWHRLARPLQPLLPGKRNTRLTQLLRVPLQPLHSADAGPGPGPGAAAGNTAAAAAAAAAAGVAPVRVVNASHYVVLVHHVTAKRGPDLLDRLAALGYMSNARLRSTASRLAEVLGLRASREKRAAAAGVGAKVDPQRGMRAVVQRYYRLFYESGHEWRGEEAQPIKTVAAGNATSGVTSPRGPVAEALEEGGSGTRVSMSAAAGPGSMSTTAAAGGAGAAGRSSLEGGGGGGGSDVGSADHLWRSPALGLKRTETARIEADLHDEAKAAAEQEAEAAAETDPNGAAVAAQLKRLFPGSFLGLVPVTNHDEADKLVYKWDMAMQHLGDSVYELRMEEDRAAAEANAKELGAAEGGGGRGGGGGGDLEMGAVDGKAKQQQQQQQQQQQAATSPKLAKLRAAVEKQQAAIVELEAQIEDARQRALATPTGYSYFAMFNSSQDAQLLAQCQRVVPPQGPGALLSFEVMPAPAPDDVNWTALWVTRTWERLLRSVLFWIPIIITFLIPIGPLQGALTSLTTALCSGTPSTGAGSSSNNGLYVAWWCETTGFAMRLLRAIVTGIAPSMLGFLWETYAMPQFLFLASNIRRKPVTFNGVEREIQAWFYWYAIINTFIGAVLGGGIFSQLGTFLKEGPEGYDTLQRVGTGVVNTANFFIQYVIARALFTNCLKIVFPHEGSMFTSLFRSCLCMCRPKNMRVSAFIHQPPSLRSATLYNSMMSVMLFGFAYAVISPIILPCCWFYFLTGFISYRYNLTHFYERGYDSGGRMWPALFGQMVGFLVILEVLTGTVLLTNQSWEMAAIMWGTLTPALVAFWATCKRIYLEPLHHVPLAVVAREPQGCVAVDPLVYLPCAVRPGALGWYPEQGKVWQNLDAALTYSGCSVSTEVVLAAAVAGSVAACRTLMVDEGCPCPAGLLRAAAAAGQLELCRWLRRVGIQSQQLRGADADASDVAVAVAACYGGHSHVLAWLQSPPEAGGVGLDVRGDAAAAGRLAAAAAWGGHVGLLRRLLEHLGGADAVAVTGAAAGAAGGEAVAGSAGAAAGAAGSEAAVVARQERRLTHQECAPLLALALESPTPDHRAKLDWLLQQIPQQRRDRLLVHLLRELNVVRAVFCDSQGAHRDQPGGWRERMEAVERCGMPLRHHRGVLAMHAAYGAGGPEALGWMLDNWSDARNGRVKTAVARGGHVAMLQMLKARGVRFELFDVKEAAGRGRLPALRWLLEEVPVGEHLPPGPLAGSWSRCLASAGGAGIDVATLELLHERSGVTIDLAALAKRGSLEAVQWAVRWLQRLEASRIAEAPAAAGGAGSGTGGSSGCSVGSLVRPASLDADALWAVAAAGNTAAASWLRAHGCAPELLSTARVVKQMAAGMSRGCPGLAFGALRWWLEQRRAAAGGADAGDAGAGDAEAASASEGDQENAASDSVATAGLTPAERDLLLGGLSACLPPWSLERLRRQQQMESSGEEGLGADEEDEDEEEEENKWSEEESGSEAGSNVMVSDAVVHAGLGGGGGGGGGLPEQQV